MSAIGATDGHSWISYFTVYWSHRVRGLCAGASPTSTREVCAVQKRDQMMIHCFDGKGNLLTEQMVSDLQEEFDEFTKGLRKVNA